MRSAGAAAAAAVDLQLVVAGLALLVAVEQCALWWWVRRSTATALLGLAGVGTAVVLACNVLVLTLPTGDLTWWLYARCVALSMLAVVAVLLFAALANERPPLLVLGVVSFLAAARIVLWPTTDLLFTHRYLDGAPLYGGVLALVSLPMMAVAFGYLFVVVLRDRTPVELIALAVASIPTAVLAVLSFTVTDRLAVEELTGWLTVPMFGAIVFIASRRQVSDLRRMRLLAGHQSALARLARRGLTTSASELAREARLLVAGQPNGEQEFVEAVENVAAAAVRREGAEAIVLQRAKHDELTGLPNRDLVRSLLGQALDACPPDSALTILCLGVDTFRSVNDSHGYAVGDAVLAELATRLQEFARGSSFAGRLGSDEFAVVSIDAQNPFAAVALAHRVSESLEQPIELDDFDSHVTVSVGVVVARARRGITADTVLHDADIAMYRAKERGGDAIELFDSSMRTDLLHLRHLERRLRDVVVRDELVVHYEPIVDLETGRAASIEALARWRHEGQLLTPARWVSVAESTGQIVEIGERVLGVAIAQLLDWERAGHDLSISVNVSARQLNDRRLQRAIEVAIAGGFPAHRLCLEVTERMAVDDSAVAALAVLRSLGVRVAIDDFGTGYSALGSLSRLPVDVVKIDSSFTARLTHKDGVAVVTAVLAMARTLDLDVIAEGIETEAQARTLAHLGCRLGQGHLFGYAASASELRLDKPFHPGVPGARRVSALPDQR